MKKFFILCLTLFALGCSSIIPYKDQNLDYLYGIEKDPDAYRGQVVSFGGEVKGITEDTLRIRLVLKVEAPLYYYATGKANAIAYEMILVTFNKRGMPAMTGIKKGNEIKVLARVRSYETRRNFAGSDIAVLHLLAFAISDHTRHKDFFRPETPERQLYESWKEGRLFFEESAQDVIDRCPKATTPRLPKRFTLPPPPEPVSAPKEPATGIIFDAEEPPFILPPDPPQETTETEKPADESASPAVPSAPAEPISQEPVLPTAENLPPTPQSAPAPADPLMTAPAQTVPETEPGQPAEEEGSVPPDSTPVPLHPIPGNDILLPALAPTPAASSNPELKEPTAPLPLPAPTQETAQPAATAPAEVSLSSAGEN